MKLFHHSAEPLKTVYSTPQPDHDDPKPQGLWVTTESGHTWKDFCEGADWALDRFVHQTEVVLRPDANVLKIGTVAALDAFNEKYRSPSNSRYGGIDMCVRWRDVAAEFDGIVIAPYQWRRRLEINWYYGWDCASGCIWNADAINGLRPVEQPANAQQRAA